MPEFRAQFASQAKQRALSQLVIEKIVSEEKITASEEEVEAKVAEQAASVDKTAEEYKKSMDPRQLDYIRNDVIITKLFALLSENNELYTDENSAPAKKPAAKKTAAKKPAEEGETAEKKPAAKKPAAKKKTEKPE